MKLLVIDDEPKWLAYCLKQGADCSTCIPPDVSSYDMIILASRFLHLMPELSGQFVIVATSQPTVPEAILAYRAGAKNYLAKDFSLTINDLIDKP